jgi:tetratricopeptide (TPR) repeat protein
MNYFNKAFLYFSNKNYKKSIEYFNKSISYNIEIETCYYNISVCHMELKDYYSAIKIHNLLINEKKIISDSIFYNQGLCYFIVNNPKKALVLFLKCLDINPTHLRTINNIATIYIKQNEYDTAITYLNKGLNINKNYVNFYINIGECYNKLKQYNKSLTILNIGLKLNKDIDTLILLHNNIGLSYQGLKKYNTAINYYDKCIKLDKNYIPAYNNKAICYYDMGDYEKSIDIGQKAYNIDPNDKIMAETLIKNYFDYDQFNKIINFDKIHFNLNKNSIFISLVFYIKGDYANFKKCIINNRNIKHNVNDSKFIIPYKNLLDILYKNLIIEKETCNKIYHIGESHSLSTTNKHVELNNKKYKIETKLIIGCKAWHLNNSSKLNNYKANFIHKINQINKNNKIQNNKEQTNVLISIGEIDCRINEGILIYHKKSGKHLEDIVSITVENYINFINSIPNINHLKVWLFNIPYPNIYKNSDEVAKIVALFNEKLEFYIKRTSFNIIDLYSITRENNSFYIDNHHLSFNVYKTLIESYLL